MTSALSQMLTLLLKSNLLHQLFERLGFLKRPYCDRGAIPFQRTSELIALGEPGALAVPHTLGVEPGHHCSQIEAARWRDRLRQHWRAGRRTDS